jgi:hypothetical protein
MTDDAAAAAEQPAVNAAEQPAATAAAGGARPSGRPSLLYAVVAALALVAHLTVGLLYVSSGLVAPLWAVVLLLVLWAAQLVACGLLLRRRSWWVLAVPVVALALWVLLINAGSALLGWTA